MKKRLLLFGAMLAARLMVANAAVDPNFYIYICFGQSNMEGNAAAEAVDKTNVDKRFRLLATCDYSSPKRTTGNWYDAIPPLVNPVGGIGPTDYFGRTMVAALPADVKIGVIPVAMGGSPIEMFDKDKYKSKLAQNPNEWWATLAKQHYGGNPYGRIIDMAKKAQEVGVIKGILLHQGCSNNGDPNWPNMVKKIYTDMLKDLNLAADTVPLFVGETLRQENGGSCYGHNVQVDRMPSVVKTSHVVSSEGLPGNGQDPWHFNAVGYRIFGKRYAFEALKLMGKPLKADPEYNMAASLKKFYTVKSLSLSKDVSAIPGYRIPVTATYQDNHKEDVTNDMQFTSDDVAFTDGIISGAGQGQAQAIYTDFLNNQTVVDFNISVKYFPLKKEYITKLSGTLTFDEAEQSITLTSSGQAGWVYENGIDLSAYKYLVVKLKQEQEVNAVVRVYAKNNINTSNYKDTINSRTQVVIDLQNMVYNKSGAKIDPSNVAIVAFRFGKKGTIFIDDVFLSNDEQYNPTGISPVNNSPQPADNTVFSLQGTKAGTTDSWQRLRKGIYVVNGKLRQKR